MKRRKMAKFNEILQIFMIVFTIFVIFLKICHPLSPPSPSPQTLPTLFRGRSDPRPPLQLHLWFDKSRQPLYT